MGQHEHLRLRYQHNQAVDGLVTLLTKAHHDLSVIDLKLEKEFQQAYPDDANPMKLVARIKKIEEELSSLKDRCRELLAAKQDLIDKASSVLVGNRNMLQRMQSSVGMAVSTDSADSAYANFNKIIEEWTSQVRSRTGDERQDDSEDINKLLFSSIVGSS